MVPASLAEQGLGAVWVPKPYRWGDPPDLTLEVAEVPTPAGRARLSALARSLCGVSFGRIWIRQAPVKPAPRRGVHVYGVPNPEVTTGGRPTGALAFGVNPATNELTAVQVALPFALRASLPEDRTALLRLALYRASGLDFARFAPLGLRADGLPRLGVTLPLWGHVLTRSAGHRGRSTAGIARSFTREANPHG